MARTSVCNAADPAKCWWHKKQQETPHQKELRQIKEHLARLEASPDPDIQAALKDAKRSVEEENKQPAKIRKTRQKNLLRWLEEQPPEAS